MTISNTEHHSEIAIAEAVRDYEELCNAGCAQGMDAKGKLKFIQQALLFRGREYCTLTLARYGSKRSIEYIRKGGVDGYSLNENGEIVSERGSIIKPYVS